MHNRTFHYRFLPQPKKLANSCCLAASSLLICGLNLAFKGVRGKLLLNEHTGGHETGCSGVSHPLIPRLGAVCELCVHV